MELEYVPLLTEDDCPPIYINTEIMEEDRPQLEKLYYDETNYDTYLEQLWLLIPLL